MSARLAEMERLRPGGDGVGAAFWNRRARWYASRTAGSGDDDPLLRTMRRFVGPATTVLDVGAGPGRLTIPLARRAAGVTAVDPSTGMLRILRRDARRAGVGNVTCVLGAWQDVSVLPADVALCSFVLPVVPHAGRFLSKMDRAARRRAFLSMSAVSVDMVYDPLWRHFHGAPRRPAPTYLDALAVLDELGIAARAEVVEAPSRTSWATLDRAVADVREWLLLADAPEVRRELRGLLGGWLVGGRGALRPPGATRCVAVISWSPSHAARTRTD